MQTSRPDRGVHPRRLHLHYGGWEAALQYALRTLQSEPSRRVRVHLIWALAHLATPKTTAGANLAAPAHMLPQVCVCVCVISPFGHVAVGGLCW